MAIKVSKGREGAYAAYKTSGKEASNRKKKLECQLRLQPGNKAQIELAIKNIHHRRKTPVTPYWSHSMISLAKLLKRFTGKFDKLAFSPDPLVSATAVKARNSNAFLGRQLGSKASMFSLGTRAHDTSGYQL